MRWATVIILDRIKKKNIEIFIGKYKTFEIRKLLQSLRKTQKDELEKILINIQRIYKLEGDFKETIKWLSRVTNDAETLGVEIKYKLINGQQVVIFINNESNEWTEFIRRYISHAVKADQLSAIVTLSTLYGYKEPKLITNRDYCNCLHAMIYGCSLKQRYEFCTQCYKIQELRRQTQEELVELYVILNPFLSALLALEPGKETIFSKEAIAKSRDNGCIWVSGDNLSKTGHIGVNRYVLDMTLNYLIYYT